MPPRKVKQTKSTTTATPTATTNATANANATATSVKQPGAKRGRKPKKTVEDTAPNTNKTGTVATPKKRGRKPKKVDESVINSSPSVVDTTIEPASNLLYTSTQSDISSQSIVQSDMNNTNTSLIEQSENVERDNKHYTEADREEMVKQIEELNKEKHLEFLGLFLSYNVAYSENNNGVFINLSNVSNQVLDVVKQKLNYIETQNNELMRREEELNHILE